MKTHSIGKSEEPTSIFKIILMILLGLLVITVVCVGGGLIIINSVR